MDKKKKPYTVTASSVNNNILSLFEQDTSHNFSFVCVLCYS